ncbi:NUDIX hydrolase [Chengkuizengella axinellae]|uniref:NUDIX hydrolase n=1 Tax=Chengkuizengella axinellae TaxID=3064388 RepID=A0ABT9IW37_9BACL|nr:NUDIX hydrolase [Chengkuizengella sp. 2205SS18-9]MDP5273589.1 NUDIX hydrolase [Chengkuizengella sp. 2205SS18-9]
MNKVVVKKIPTNVKITVSEKLMDLPQSLQESINLYWDSLIKSGETFHRGDIFSIKKIKETENELLVTLHKTDFAHFLYTKHHKIPEKFNCPVIVANGLILTKDNYFILGKMNNQTANPARIQFIAGGIDNKDIHGDTVDILGSLFREAKEEIGIDLKDRNLVTKIEPRYIVHWGNIALVYLIQLDIDSLEFRKRYEQFEIALNEKGIDPEFSSIILVSADSDSVSGFFESDNNPKLDFLSPVLKQELKILATNNKKSVP